MYKLKGILKFKERDKEEKIVHLSAKNHQILMKKLNKEIESKAFEWFDFKIY